jgi:hypothetical protein
VSQGNEVSSVVAQADLNAEELINNFHARELKWEKILHSTSK